MTTYIFDFVINNNITTLYCIKNFNTFIINITNNIKFVIRKKFQFFTNDI